MRLAAIILLAFGLGGCDNLDQGVGYYGSATTYSDYGVSPLQGYYPPVYQGYGQQPQTYLYQQQPYYYQPSYGRSYRPFYDQPYNDDGFRERRHFRDEGNRQFQQPPLAQPQGPTILHSPAPITPPPAAPPSTAHNQQLLDNLGFRPNR